MSALDLGTGTPSRTTRWTFTSSDAVAATAMRSSFVAFARATTLHDRCIDTMSAELVIGELIGNVARHAPGPVTVDAEWTSEHVTLAVTNDGDAFEFSLDEPEDPLAESGRGFFLIRHFTRALDIACDGAGRCTVRAVLDICPEA